MIRNQLNARRPWHPRDPLELIVRQSRRLAYEIPEVSSNASSDADGPSPIDAEPCGCSQPSVEVPCTGDCCEQAIEIACAR